MRIKKKLILISICVTASAIDFISLFTPQGYELITIGFLGSMTVLASVIMAHLGRRWKRDKEMARIVAERLLCKPQDNSVQSSQQANILPSLGHSGMSGSMLGQLFGSNPSIGQGASSKFLDIMHQDQNDFFESTK